MSENKRFYLCEICGKVIELIHNTDISTICCGKEMKLLKANTSDGAYEKHVPAYEIDDSKEEIIVQVGEIEHPMEKDHYIMWIAQVKDDITIRRQLFPGQKPMVKMQYIKGSTIYAYCDKHGLWKKEVE